MGGYEDPTGGWAKATEEGAKFAGKAMEVAQGFGGFLSGPAREIVGMLEDRLKVARFERRVRLAKRVDEFMMLRGLDAPTRQLSLNVGLALLSHAAIEEDDELQDRWAKLLVNAADEKFDIEISKAFVSILSDMTSLDVQVLTKIASYPNAEGKQILTYQLPNAVKCENDEDRDASFKQDNPPEPSEEVAISLQNLSRLGCVNLGLTFGGGSALGGLP